MNVEYDEDGGRVLSLREALLVSLSQSCVVPCLTRAQYQDGALGVIAGFYSSNKHLRERIVEGFAANVSARSVV